VRVRSRRELSVGRSSEEERRTEPMKVESPEKDDNKDLVFAEFDGWSTENMI